MHNSQLIRGLTLLELIISLSIVAIFLTFAIPPAQKYINSSAVKSDVQIALNYFREGIGISRRSECALVLTMTQQANDIELSMRVENEPTVECQNWQTEVNNLAQINNFKVLLKRASLNQKGQLPPSAGYRINGTDGLITSQYLSAPQPFSITKGKGDEAASAIVNVQREGIGAITYD